MTLRGPLPEIDSLARQSQRGDRAAFEELVLKLSPVLTRFFCRRGSREPEDLAQKTWLQIVRNLERYDPARSFTTWAFSIAYHLWVDHLRRRQNPYSYDDIGDVPEDIGEVESADAVEHMIAKLHECIERLSDDERTIMYMRYWEDLSLETVAARMGAQYGSIKGKAHRGAKKLRECMDEKGIRKGKRI